MSDEATESATAAQSATVLTVFPNGPISIAGDFELVGRDGDVLIPGRKKAFLCRCGHSNTKPFCDGSHSANEFSDEIVPAQA